MSFPIVFDGRNNDKSENTSYIICFFRFKTVFFVENIQKDDFKSEI